MTTPEPSRTATIRTTVADAATVAAAIRPDNTDEMQTTVTEETIVTRIDRETTGGLQSTVDDYVINLEVATQVVDIAKTHAQSTSSDDSHDETSANADANTDADGHTDTNIDTTTETNDQQ